MNEIITIYIVHTYILLLLLLYIYTIKILNIPKNDQNTTENAYIQIAHLLRKKIVGICLPEEKKSICILLHEMSMNCRANKNLLISM